MGNDKQPITGMLKNEYAKLVGIPVSTLRNYMNKMYLKELSALNYSQRQKYLMPIQIDFLNKKLVIVPDL